MVEKWGHRLALAPTDKSERAGFRAATQHSMIQDHSYHYCVEIKASRTLLVTKLQELFPG